MRYNTTQRVQRPTRRLVATNRYPARNGEQEPGDRVGTNSEPQGGEQVDEVEPLLVSAKAMVRDARGRFLVLRRSPKCRTNAGKWELPGGKAASGESLETALMREVAEETGLVISVRNMSGVTRSRPLDRDVICFVFQARAESGQVRLCDEHDAFEWVDVRDALRLDVVDELRACLEDATCEP